jgi:uncharacterized membrane protein
MTTSRLEAFSDGVIAVIITIMVLELHVPHEEGWPGLWSVAPRLAVYLMSFLMVGIYWVNHHDLMKRTEEVDHGVLWANLGFLFVLSLIPYFVEYLDDKMFNSFSAVLYESTMMAAGLAFFVLRWTVMRRQLYAGALQASDKAELWKHVASLLLYVISIPLAFYSPWLSLSINILVTLIWVLPQLGTQGARKHQNRRSNRHDG